MFFSYKTEMLSVRERSAIDVQRSPSDISARMLIYIDASFAIIIRFSNLTTACKIIQDPGE